MDPTKINFRALVDIVETTRIIELINNHKEQSVEFMECFEERFPQIEDLFDIETDFHTALEANIAIRPSQALLDFIQDLL